MARSRNRNQKRNQRVSRRRVQTRRNSRRNQQSRSRSRSQSRNRNARRSKRVRRRSSRGGNEEVYPGVTQEALVKLQKCNEAKEKGGNKEACTPEELETFIETGKL